MSTLTRPCSISVAALSERVVGSSHPTKGGWDLPVPAKLKPGPRFSDVELRMFFKLSHHEIFSVFSPIM